LAKATEYAESRKETVVGQLDAATGIVREFADTAGERFGEPVAKVLHQGSDALDAVTRKLESQSIEDTVSAARTTIVRYPGIALAVASVAGFLAGRIVKAGLSQPGTRRLPSNDSNVTEVAA
jgi:molybdopterin-guanine dinucleotide biosynthesis protein A